MSPKLEQAFFNSTAPIIGAVALGLDFIEAVKSAAVEKLTGKRPEAKTSYLGKVMGPYV
ncbi:MAG: hypothetical protein RBR86_05400 [Pseudobdellovibrionaceae bacterium]|jgi:hypothetical protein|nr:hypothetical protein [Pseudobdellovibrionaceae bacterium]